LISLSPLWFQSWAEEGHLEPDVDDPDQQSLLLWYPTVTAPGNEYIRRAIKIQLPDSIAARAFKICCPKRDAGITIESKGYDQKHFWWSSGLEMTYVVGVGIGHISGA
jgi:hypothetical protein